MDLFITLFMVMVWQVYASVWTLQNVYIKYGNFLYIKYTPIKKKKTYQHQAGKMSQDIFVKESSQ